MKRGRIAAAAAGLVVVAIAGIVLIARANASVPEISVVQAERGELVRAVTVSGRTEMGEKADVYPPSAGTLAEVFVEEGDTVMAGDPLAVLDTAPLELQVAGAEAAYEGAVSQFDALDAQQPTSADAAVAEAAVGAAWDSYVAAQGLTQSLEEIITHVESLGLGNVDLSSIETTDPVALALIEMLEQLEAEGIIRSVEGVSLALLRTQLVATEAQANQAYGAYLQAAAQRDALEGASGSAGSARSAARAGVEQAYQALVLARETLSEATMTAPIGGVVVFNTAGGSIAGVDVPAATPGSGYSVTPAAAPFTIVRLGRLQFVGDLDEADVDSVAPGAAARVSLDAFPGIEFETVIARVGVVARLTTTGGNVFPAYMGINDTGRDILVGMRGSADIELERIADTVSAPIEALFDEDDQAIVYIVEDDRARRVVVQTGTYTETRVEILSGLQGDETLALTSSAEMSDGMRVRVVEGSQQRGTFGPFGGQ